jgi:hypothetical protein
MGLIVVNAKVKLMSEEDMEDLEGHEKRGTEPQSSKWVWRSMTIHTDDIKRLIQYNKKKTVILGYDGESILVDEPFSDVYLKWDQNKEEVEEFHPDFGIESDETEPSKDEEKEED